MTPDEQRKSIEDAQRVWKAMLVTAKECRRTWGMGFPVISTELLRKYWAEATGYYPPEKEER